MRVKGGSEVQFTTSLPADPLDPVDPLDLLDPLDPLDPLACAKVVFCVRETLFFVSKTQK